MFLLSSVVRFVQDATSLITDFVWDVVSLTTGIQGRRLFTVEVCLTFWTTDSNNMVLTTATYQTPVQHEFSYLRDSDEPGLMCEV